MDHKYQAFVPVVDYDRRPLMPTKWSRAWRWVRQGKATYFYKHGILCVRLNREPSARHLQDTAVGVDPGSKFEGYSVKSEAHTYLNLQTDARTAVKDAMEFRSNLRRTRRNRNTPYRPCRSNRHRDPGFIPPSIKARWQWRLKIISILCSLFPVSYIGIEDAAFRTIKDVRKTQYVKNHNTLVSWVQNGKQWFYDQLAKIVPPHQIYTVDGYSTYQMRTGLGLSKSKDKSLKSFWSHCVDAWVIASQIVGCRSHVDNLDFIHLKPIRFARRQIQVANPLKGGIRKLYGTTWSMGLIRGTLVRHPTYGVSLVGGSSKGRISLHDPETGARLSRSIRPTDCTVLQHRPWIQRVYYYHGSIVSPIAHAIQDLFHAHKPQYRSLYSPQNRSLNYYTRPLSVIY